MTQASPIKRRTVTSAVLELIRDRIISGLYAGGQQIRQEAIAEELGVSRIPIREALVQLEAEGLVVIHTHKGAMVTALTTADAVDIFEARQVLEPFILRTAMAQAQPADVERVWSAYRDYEAGLKAGEPPMRLSQLNWAFHSALCQPAARPRSQGLLTTLYNSADRYLRLQIDAAAAQGKALADHLALARAYEAGEVETAMRLLDAHIRDARDDVIAGLAAARLADN